MGEASENPTRTDREIERIARMDEIRNHFQG